MKKIIITALLLLLIVTYLFALDEREDNLLLATQPVYYGEKSFVERIQQRTGEESEALGLVLTGGSARALAHIGVLKYLEENEIIPDFIVSNSMGSIVALLYAAGLSPDQILDLYTSVDLGSLFDIALPLNHGLLETFEFESLISSILGKDVRLESLEIPVMIICEDLKTKRQVRICEGDFYTVFTASYALPIYFTPVEFEGHLLIDGGVANIAPVDAAYKYTSNVIVSTTFYSGSNTNLKSPITVLNTAFDIGKRRSAIEELSAHEDAVWIRCNVEDFSFMAFDRGKEMAENGYKSAAEQKEKIKDINEKLNSDKWIKHDIEHALKEKRNGYEKQLNKTVKKIQSGGLFRVRKPVLYPSMLLESNLIGAGFKARVGGLYVFAGPAFSFVANTREADLTAEITAHLAWNLSTVVNLKTSISYIPLDSFKAFENLKISLFSNKKIKLFAGESFELTYNDALIHNIFSVYLNAETVVGDNKGILLTDFAFELPDSIPGFKFDVDFTTDIATVLGVGLNGTYHYKGGDKQLWYADAGAKLFWHNPDNSPTLSEMFVVSNLKIGLFADLKYTINTYGYIDLGDERPDLIAGMFISGGSNLLGLIKMPIEIKAGYDFLYEGFYLSFNITE